MKKKLIVLLQMVIAIVLIANSVYATVSATLNLNVSSNTVKKGDEVTVTLSLKDVNSEQKVRSISGYINYDEEVIEKVTADNIVKNAENKVSIGSENLSVEDLTNRDIDDMPDTSAYLGFNGAPTSNNDIKIVIDFNNGVTSDEDLFTMKFKVKADANLGEIENAIEYKMFVITAGTSDKSEEITKNIDLTITSSSSNDDSNQNKTNTNETNQNKTNTNQTNQNKTNTNQTNQNKTNQNKTNTNQTNQNKTATNKVNNASTKNTTNKTNVTNNANKVVIGNTNKDNTLSSNVLPATGARAIIVPAIILILCAYICYNRYMNYKGI